jgi:transposase-like protein
MRQNMALEPIPSLDFNSDEWHADETVIKIKGVKHYIWFIIDAETRFVLGFHLSPRHDSPQAFALFERVKGLGKPQTLVSERNSAYIMPARVVLGVRRQRVASFDEAAPNNLIERFHKQFKAWYKTKNGFGSFVAANNMIATFVFFFNFVRPLMALSGLTPAQVAGLSLSQKQRRKYLNLVA